MEVFLIIKDGEKETPNKERKIFENKIGAWGVKRGEIEQMKM